MDECKIELEGELFVIIEEQEDRETLFCAEIGGINIFDWLRQNNGNKVKIILEKLKVEK